MYFLGYNAYHSSGAGTQRLSSDRDMQVKLYGGTYDDIIMSADMTKYGAYAIDWDNMTILYSQYDGTSTAGNIDFAVDSIQSVRVKRRKVGEYNWITLQERPITCIDDLKITYEDLYAENDTDYEYGIVPVVNSAEQRIDSVQVYSQFDGAIITDGTTTYHVLLEPTVQQFTKKRNCSVVTTMSSKYPYVIFNGDANYDSGSFSGVGLEINNDTDMPNIAGAVAYRQNFAYWLTNGKPKILKMFDGRSWMINVDGDVTVSEDGNYQKVQVSFNFVEIGDTNSQTDMYENGFININVEGS